MVSSRWSYLDGDELLVYVCSLVYCHLDCLCYALAMLLLE